MLQAGDILISEPYLGDDNFERTVVLLGTHDSEGTVGFIFNKRLNMFLSDVVDIEEEGEDWPLYMGGPVEPNTLHFLYTAKAALPGSIEIIENVFWGGDFELLLEDLKHQKIQPEQVRFFLGYSGWAEGQLQNEIEQKAWIIHRLEAEEIFDMDSENMWREVLKKMGGQYRELSNYPIDPRLN
jgi:putative transcriptional regulator